MFEKREKLGAGGISFTARNIVSEFDTLTIYTSVVNYHPKFRVTIFIH